ncbi:MAG: hypothetical protein IPP74_11725 [Alphaproteobacteria bacterium]|nr:hypothetical protein [Alphaproteobacteria bacterium]
MKDGVHHGFEFKYTSSPKMTKSLSIALEDLGLETATIIIPHGEAYPLAGRVRVCALTEFIKSVASSIIGQ